MNFITLDFETADFTKYSPCKVGYSIVRNNEIIETNSFLIKPYCFPEFDEFNISINKITPEMVKDSPTFDELYASQLNNIFKENIIVCHNSSFHLGVLKETLETYNINLPQIRYLCTYTLSKRLYNLLRYDIYSVANALNFLEFNITNDSHKDSILVAKIALEIFKKNNVKSELDIPSNLHYNFGKLEDESYKGFTHIRNYISIKDRIANSELEIDEKNFDKDSIFYNKNVVFTGKMNSMSRIEAAKIILSIGGNFSDKLNKNTNILVVGQQDIRFVGESGESSKQKQAQLMKDKGHEIEVFSEHEFLQNLNI